MTFRFQSAHAPLAGAVVAFCAASLVAGCRNVEAQKTAKKTQELVTDATVPVRLAAAKTMDLNDNLEVTGAFVTSEQSAVGSTVAGRLVAVFVKDGDQVRAGQAIAQIETIDLMTRLRQSLAQAAGARSALEQAQSDARVGPTKSAANVRAAQARLTQARARFDKASNGSRSEERTQAEWGVKKAKSDLDTAKSNLDRAQRLYQEGAIAKVDVETAENRYANSLAAYEGALQTLSIVQSSTRPEDLAAAREDVRAAQETLNTAMADQRLDVVFAQRVEAARANLESVQEQVRLSQKALGDATVRSPFSGRVSGKPIQVGTYVAPGAPIATIVGGSGIYFEANVPETKVALVRLGAAVEVRVDALQGVRLTGTVTAVNPVASEQGRLFTVRVSVAEGLGALRPGMFARGTVRLGTRRGVVVVPSEAIVRDGEDAYVFTVAEKKAARKKVVLGLQNDGVTEIQGVQSGDQVVVTGQTGLVDGSPVRIETAKKGA